MVFHSSTGLLLCTNSFVITFAAMQVHSSVENLPPFIRSVITIGTFDGVHTGHQKIIQALVVEARRVNGESIIITFHPHPRKIIIPNQRLELLTTLEEKIEILSAAGIDHLVVVPFTLPFAEQTAEAYLKDFLVGRFHPHSIIIGYDHHFGKNRKGNFQFLEQNAEPYNYKLIEIPVLVLEEISVSSTKIRQAIHYCQVEIAKALLGYSFFFSGTVTTGDKFGRELGYPTANLQYADMDKIELGHGVYAVYVVIDGVQKNGMLSIGNRPTLTGSGEKIEVNIFDWEKEIYGTIIKVIVPYFLRAQEKYDSLDALKNQLHKDKEASLKLL